MHSLHLLMCVCAHISAYASFTFVSSSASFFPPTKFSFHSLAEWLSEIKIPHTTLGARRQEEIRGKLNNAICMHLENSRSKPSGHPPAWSVLKSTAQIASLTIQIPVTGLKASTLFRLFRKNSWWNYTLSPVSIMYEKMQVGTCIAHLLKIIFAQWIEWDWFSWI